MARKRPPGSKKKGPGGRSPDIWSMRPHWVDYRIRNSDPVVFFPSRLADTIGWEANSWVNRDDPENGLPRCSLFLFGDEMTLTPGESIMTAFNLSRKQRAELAAYLLRLGEKRGWEIWNAVEDEAVLN